MDGRPYTVAALVQSNHGLRESFTVLGVPVGKHLPLGSSGGAQDMGSIIILLAAVQCSEEAVINAMLAAEDAPQTSPGGGVCKALDHAELVRIMQRYGRMGAVASG